MSSGELRTKICGRGRRTQWEQRSPQKGAALENLMGTSSRGGKYPRPRGKHAPQNGTGGHVHQRPGILKKTQGNPKKRQWEKKRGRAKLNWITGTSSRLRSREGEKRRIAKSGGGPVKYPKRTKKNFQLSRGKNCWHILGRLSTTLSQSLQTRVPSRPAKEG